MKILHVIPGNPPRPSIEVSQSVQRLSEAIRASGGLVITVEVVLVDHGRLRIQSKTTSESSTKIFLEVDRPAEGSWLFSPFHADAEVLLLRILRQASPDLVHTHFPVPICSKVTRIAASLSIPALITVHEELPPLLTETRGDSDPSAFRDHRIEHRVAHREWKAELKSAKAVLTPDRPAAEIIRLYEKIIEGSAASAQAPLDWRRPRALERCRERQNRARDRLIDRLLKEISTIPAKNQAIQEQQELARTTKRAIDKTQEKIINLRAELANHKKRLKQYHQDLANERNKLIGRDAELAEAKAALIRIENRLAGQETDVDEQRQAALSKKRELEECNEQLTTHQQRIEEARAEADKKQLGVEEQTASLSQERQLVAEVALDLAAISRTAISLAEPAPAAETADTSEDLPQSEEAVRAVERIRRTLQTLLSASPDDP